LSLTAGTAVAAPVEDFARIGHHRESRAFWMSNAFPSRQDRDGEAKAAPKFTTTYMDGIARRFGPSGGHMDFFDRRLGGAYAPALAGTVDGGAAKLVLRWNTGD
jgi:hypothetical protein